MLNNLAHALSAIQNGYSGKCFVVPVPRTFLNFVVLTNLYDAGYIAGFQISAYNHYKYNVELKYMNLNEPVLHHFKIISKPSQRIYMSVSELKQRFASNDFVLIQSSLTRLVYYIAPGINVFDTSSLRSTGLITLKTALIHNHGGEVLFAIN